MVPFMKVTIYDEVKTLQDVFDEFYEKGVKRIDFEKVKVTPSDICGASVTFEYTSDEMYQEEHVVSCWTH